MTRWRTGEWYTLDDNGKEIWIITIWADTRMAKERIGASFGNYIIKFLNDTMEDR